VELRNRLANESAATAQAARQSTHQFLAILHVSGYAGFESAAQWLSPTTSPSCHQQNQQQEPQAPSATGVDGVAPSRRERVEPASQALGNLQALLDEQHVSH
jgi:hypothetical protein